MARSCKDRRVAAAPGFMVQVGTAKLFKWLSPDSKDRVWRIFADWLDVACQRGAELVLPESQDLNDQENDTLLSLCRYAADGIESYWNNFSHPRDNRRTTGEQSPNDRRTTGEQSLHIRQTDDEQPKEGSIEFKKGITEELSEAAHAHAEGFNHPTVDDVRRFAADNGLKDDAECFVSYYAARGWTYRDGQPLTNWEAAYRLWLQREKQLQDASLKKMPAQQYEQRDYSEERMREILGVDDLFK